MYLQRLLPFALVSVVSASSADAQSSEVEQTAGTARPSDDPVFHLRVGFGLNPVFNDEDYLPQVHAGFGGSLAGFLQLPHRLSVGGAFDWERYTFDSSNYGDALDAPPRYRDEELIHMRLMGLVQWDVLPRRFITPFVVAGVGYGWERATLTSWQCDPALASGLVFGGGGGLDMAVHDHFGVGLEYRGNTLPDGTTTCSLAEIPDEPKGPPGGFFSHRIGITFSVRD